MSSRTLVGVILFIVVIILLIRVFQPAGAVSPKDCSTASVQVNNDTRRVSQVLFCHVQRSLRLSTWEDVVIPGPGGWTWQVTVWTIPVGDTYTTYFPLVSGNPITISSFATINFY